MKKLKKALSILTLIVLIGSDFLTSLSYALDDMLEESVVIQTENGEETENVETEEEIINQEDNEYAYEDEGIGEEELEIVEGVTGDVEELTGEVSEIDSGEVEELTEETIEGATGYIIEELTLDIVEGITGDVEELTGAINGSTKIGEETITENTTYNEKPIIGEKTYNDVTVRVEALTGTFPEGTNVAIEPIKWGDLSVLKNKLVEEQEEIKEDTTVVAFDITFIYKGEEVQPKEGEKVKVIFNYSDNKTFKKAEADDNQTIEVYHINDKDENGEKVEKGEETIEKIEINQTASAEVNNGLVIDAEKFSTYTIVVQRAEQTNPNTGNPKTRTRGVDYFTINIPRPEGQTGPEGFTIMDRNLGADAYMGEDGKTADDWDGYYYQWGNNYGFAAVGNVPTTNRNAIYDGTTMAHNGYSGNVFISTNGSDYWRCVEVDPDDPNSDCVYPNHGELRGGENDSLSNNRGLNTISSTAVNRQGPCPGGWHVPSAGEWNKLIDYWASAYVISGGTVSLSSPCNTFVDNTNGCSTIKSFNGTDATAAFMDDLKLPLAGYRTKGPLYQVAYVGDYWSSTPLVNKNNYFYAGILSLKTSEVRLTNNTRNFGFSVRCFKDVYEPNNTPISTTGYFRAFDGSGTSLFGMSFDKITITGFTRNTTLGLQDVLAKDGVTEIESTGGNYISDYPIYAWIENNNFNWWSEAETVYFHPDTTKAFKGMSGVKIIDLTGTSTELVENFAYWFDNDRSLTTIKGKINTNGVKIFDDSGITYLETNENDPSSSQGMSFMFNDCKKLTSVDLSEFNTTNVIDMKRMFAGCNTLTGIDINHFDTSNVKTFYWMFRANNALKELDLSNFDTSSVINMNAMFLSSINLKTITLGEHWDTSNVKIMERMFNGLSKLETIYADIDFDITSVTKSSNMFAGDSKLVGGRGLANETPFNSSKTNATYAKIASDYPAQSGYFTKYATGEHTIIFENWNGDILWSGKIEDGIVPVYSGNDPTRPATEESVYTFTGWYPELYPATHDETYTAIYTESTRYYTVTLTGTPAGYGTLSTGSLSKEYGAAIVISGDKLTIGGTEVTLTGNEGYEFQEWTGTCGKVEKQVCDEHIIYSHPDPIEFTGGNNLEITNPGYDLFSESNYQKDFEISFDIVDQDLSSSVDQATILNVKDEDQENIYPGFAIRKSSSAGKIEITATSNYGKGYKTNKNYSLENLHSIKISRINSILYVSINGSENEQLYDYSGFNNYFTKPIVFGSSYQSGNMFRPAKVTLSNILIKTVDTCYTGNVYVVTGDCQMTAKFTTEDKYEITFVNDDGTELQKGIVASGTVPVYEGETPTKTGNAQFSYTFSGWTDGENEYVSGNLPIVQGAKVYTATYTSTVNKYNVSIVSSDINSGTVSTEIVEAEYGTEITISGNTLKIGSTEVIANPTSGTAQYSYTFSGWISDCNENILTGNCTFTGIFDSSINSYDVNASVATGDEDKGYLNRSGAGLYDFGETLVVIAIPELGYLFDYWEVNGGTGENLPGGVTVSGNQLTIVVNQILDIIAFFKPAGNTPYTVEHYKQNTGLTGYEFEWSGTMYGTTNEPTSATGTYYEGFNLSGNLVDYQTGIKADGSTIVRLYYNRNTYTVTRNMWEGHLDRKKIDENVPYGMTPVFEWDDEDKYTPKRGREVDTDDIKYDFIFTGWIKNEDSQIIKDLTTQIVTGNVVYTAQYDTGYRYYEVRYHPGEGTGSMENNNLQLYISGNLNKNTFTKTGYEFSGWMRDLGEGGEIFYEDEQEVNLGIEDVDGEAERYLLFIDLYAQWKPSTGTKVTINYYLKDLDVDNNVLINSSTEYATGIEFTGAADSVIDSILARFGTEIEGYEYSKSIVYGPDYPSGIETGTTTVLADGSRVIDMYYVPSIYQFTLNSESYSNTEGSSENTGYYYGAKVTLSGDSNDDCFTRSGWTTSGITLSDSTFHQTWFVMPANDVKVAPSTTENTYNIIFNGNGSTSGTMSPMNRIKCTESTGLTLNVFEKSGHTFTGWSTTQGGIREYTNGATVDRLSTGADVNLYAVWDINNYGIIGNVAKGQENMGYLSGEYTTGANLTGTYNYGTELIFTAVPKLGYLFDYWEISGSGYVQPTVTESGNQLTVIVDQILDIIAHFKENEKTVTVNYYEMNTGGLYSGINNSTTFTGLVGHTGYATVNIPYGFHLDTTQTTNTGILISENDPENIIDIYYARNQHELNIFYTGDFQYDLVDFNPVLKQYYYYGEHIYTNVIAHTGYRVDNLTCSGGDNIYIHGTEIEFDMGDENVSIIIDGSKNRYRIDYYLDGGIENPVESNNITGYTINDGSIQIHDPIKTGHNFLGWTGGVSGDWISTPTSGLVIDVENGLGDREYYANWELKPYIVNVTIDPENGGTVRGTGEYHYGETFSLMATPNLGYDFMGWYTYEGYNKISDDYQIGVQADDSGGTGLIAKFELRNYLVHISSTPYKGSSQPQGDNYYPHGSLITVTAEPYEGYNVKNWVVNGRERKTGDNERYTGLTLDITITDPTNIDIDFEPKPYNITYMSGDTILTGLSPNTYDIETPICDVNYYNEYGTCMYYLPTLTRDGYDFTGWYNNPRISSYDRIKILSGMGDRIIYAGFIPTTYKVYYHLGSGETLPEWYIDNFDEYTIESLRTYLPEPKKQGYDFLGWKNDNNQIITGFGGGITGDLDLYPIWTGKVMDIEVRYHEMDIDGNYNYYTHYDYTGITNSIFNVPDYTHTGFKQDRESYPDQPTYIVVSGNNEANIIDVYYEREEYKITIGESEHGSVNGETGSQKYGKVITFTATPEIGYVFDKWFKNGEKIEGETENKLTLTIEEGMEISGYFTASTGTEYKVEYYYQNVEDGNYPSSATSGEIRKGTTDTTGEIIEDDRIPTMSGYSFDSENEMNVLSGNINGSGDLVLKVYFKKQFRVKYLTGDKGLFEVEIYEGLNYSGNTPEFVGNTGDHMPGYTFNGWQPEVSDKVTKNEDYVAQWIANTGTEYKVEYYKENLEGGYDVWTGIQYGTSDTQGVAEELIFTGFTYDSGNVNNVTTGNINGDGSRVLKLYYNREIYTITWLNEDGTNMDTTTVKYGEVPTHENPTQPADSHYTYEFKGWDPEPTFATGETSYRATYEYIVNKYTITWKNDDGSVIDTTMVEYGEIPTHSKPTKPETENYRYIFAGWTPELTGVVGDTEYTAVFNAEEKEEPSKGGNASGGGGRKSTIENFDTPNNQHGSAEKSSDLFTGDNNTNSGNINNETLSLYQWARENNITTMDTLEEANPDGLLTRGHMAKMVVNFAQNVLGRTIPTTYSDKCNWKDKESERESTEIKEYAKKACTLGLMGIYVEEFMPNKILDRAEFGTVISRLLWGDKYNVLDTDYRSYYEDHLRILKKNGILTQINEAEDRLEIRKRVWLVFRRISEKYKK